MAKAAAKAAVVAEPDAAAVVPNGDNPIPDSALVQAFKSARRVSTPIVAVETPAAAATITMLRRTLPEKTPVLAWDCAKGLRGLNDLGKAAFATMGIDANASVNATETLLALEHAPELSVVFLHNFHLQMKDTPVIQALWNLRDLFKMNKRTVVLLGPTFALSAELAGDIIVLDEPLPTRGELAAIVDQQHKNAGLALPDDTVKAAVLDAVVGLAHYTTEQVVAMALRKEGISVQQCWERKIKSVENTPGLTVYKPVAGDTGLAELKGLDNVVSFAQELIAADAFNLIVFLDEMDKSFAGGMAEHVGDSGVGKDQVGQILTYMNDTKSLGMLLAGVAGSGKTQLAKAMGAASGKPVIVLDLGGAKGGVVGQSETQIRNILKVITATAEGRVLFIGTANRTTMFTPELNRRFRKQFFFDLPDDSGRAAIWPVYAKKNGLTASQAAIPAGFDAGWTGAEIQAACEEAALFGKTVVQAARYIIPQAVSAKAVIAQMRRESSGRFLSASYEGFYQPPADQPVVEAPVLKQRAIEVN
jgi:hypothetical protein